jgi:hypothetical protein
MDDHGEGTLHSRDAGGEESQNVPSSNDASLLFVVCCLLLVAEAVQSESHDTSNQEQATSNSIHQATILTLPERSKPRTAAFEKGSAKIRSAGEAGLALVGRSLRFSDGRSMVNRSFSTLDSPPASIGSGHRRTVMQRHWERYVQAIEKTVPHDTDRRDRARTGPVTVRVAKPVTHTFK